MISVGKSITFHGPYEQFRNRIGTDATVIGHVTENTDEVDFDEVGPMYRIRFEDGFETLAWPEEVENLVDCGSCGAFVDYDIAEDGDPYHEPQADCRSVVIKNG